MGDSLYLVVLFLGAVLVLIDGQLIFRAGVGYLGEAYDNPKRARQVAGMVAVLFHMVMFGVVALVASVAFPPGAGVRSVLVRMGILLLLTALGHATTMTILSRMREQQLSTEVAEAQLDRHEHASADHRTGRDADDDAARDGGGTVAPGG
ncbi:MAG: hypothetical protein QOE32_3770 [Pseudonocardiales bacterium]|jgi:hypothetical protein|nr:hypothetical protein [Pseudonocardiales bacterium]MDT7624004.1 hypothetical protein [Pseudonocardiales bacterium]MDT7673251.1 hypothetical protein [Pseudonocardiales bacterium]